MENENYRLYVNGTQSYFESFEQAQREAKKFMPDKAELRIETLIQTSEADFWAYEYKNGKWVPS
ncbi:hypothetical protein [Pseudoalteromonas carrageenovora]|jgi:hypothetical protein|uniref:hypothetical protein n=1 Tax=Pseudoalteromonas carrageenovora TaxID=227 RepID=UPI0026E44C55|nr:hypothetical protein [Pseudoalteromonas carrageenovora]MDO6466404.1 hypothetical protein [Pseudoalteromonas carrageenovora]|tara:strand:- start:1563 stop:1754 length:192 start_codon:yes stop_codon:yes gene_type:complete